MKEKTPYYTKIAYVLILFILGMILFCLIWIFSDNTFYQSNSSTKGKRITADIYHNGVLLQSICLNQVTESYTFTVPSENNCYNEIEVRPGSIGIISASCPDKLCIHQGFIDSSLLPITCLPNRLVIQIRVDETTSDTAAPDITSY